MDLDCSIATRAPLIEGSQGAVRELVSAGVEWWAPAEKLKASYSKIGCAFLPPGTTNLFNDRPV